jgi:type II secretory pathway component PulF
MPRFTYIALDARGQESTGLVEAGSTNEAIGQLRQAGFFPTNVYEEGKAGAPAARRAGVPRCQRALLGLGGDLQELLPEVGHP